MVELQSDIEPAFHSKIEESQGLESCPRWEGLRGSGRLCGILMPADHLLAPTASLLRSRPAGAQGGMKPGSGLVQLMVQVGNADT